MTSESQWETVSVRDDLGQAGHWACLWGEGDCGNGAGEPAQCKLHLSLGLGGPEMSESSEEAGMSEHEHIRFSLLFTVDGTWPL